MLYVKTYPAPSAIHGTGLFAAEDIAPGRIIWRFTHGLDVRIHRADVPPLWWEYLDTYGWPSLAESGFTCLSTDNGRFFNHSYSPNCLSRQESPMEEVTTRALRHIHAGEELTDDYRSFGAEPPC